MTEILYLFAGILSLGIALCVHLSNNQTLEALHVQRRNSVSSFEVRKQMDENRERQKASLKKTANIFIVIGVIFMVLCVKGIFSSSPSTSDRKVTCGYCNKSYSITSSNGKNISRTNLCNSCWAFYDSASKVLGY